MIEATSTIIHDQSKKGEEDKYSRWKVSAILCAVGFVISTIFCSNWGFTYFDVVDHYLANYLMLLVGILQCFGACWMYKVHDSRDAAIKLREAGNLDEAVKEETVYLAIKIIAIGYWVPLLILGIVGNFV